MNIKNITQRQFDKVLEREGKEIKEYYANTPMKVFFRRGSKGNSSQSRLSLYYAQDTPIKVGTVFTYKDNNYVVVSRYNEESEIYYTSIATRCNATFDLTYNGKVYTVPFVEASEKFTVDSSNTISVINGSCMIYTGLNDIVKTMTVNNTYINFGGAYEVGNYFYNNNLAYVYLKRILSEDTYTFDITTDSTSYKVGDSATITASCKNGSAVISGQTITYTSSDTTIATVSTSGVISFSKEGSVTITGTWTEQNKTDNITFTVSASDTPTTNYTMTIASSGDLTLDKTRVLTPTLKDSNGNVVSAWTAVWTFNYNGMPTSDFTITYSGNTCSIKIDSDAFDDIDKVLACTCTMSGGTTSATYNGTITA